MAKSVAKELNTAVELKARRALQYYTANAIYWVVQKKWHNF